MVVVPRSISILAQGRHGDHGAAGRADPPAAADRHARTPEIHRKKTDRTRHRSVRTARLVIVSKEKKVTAFTFGLVHAPLSPFSSSTIDYDSYGKLIDFHLQHGAE